MAVSITSETKDVRSVVLVILSIVGAALCYITSIVVARLLGPDGFDNYAVAIASFALLATLAEAGTGRYALRIFPAYVASNQWSLASGYWRFSLRVVVLVSIAIAVMVAATEGIEDKQFGDYPLGIAILFLPAAALAGAGVDFVMANRAAVRGSLIARVVIPGSSLILIYVCASVVEHFHSSWAVACYGSGALIGALVAGLIFRWTSPAEVFSTPPAYRAPTWTRECFSFLTLAMLMTWIFRISIIVLETLPVGELEVAWFAAAMETGCLILLLSKSTDKYYQPYISVMIEQDQWDQGAVMRRRRVLAIGSACALFLCVIFAFGRPILRLYGEPFEAGYPALCLIAVGTCTWTMFSLAPAYLKFIGKDRFVFGTSVIGALAMAGLTWILGNVWGATGAAIAFCVVLCAVSITFLIHASRDLADKQQISQTTD